MANLPTSGNAEGFHVPTMVEIRCKNSNGWRYQLVGGTRQRYFDGSTFEPHKLPDCPQGMRRIPPAVAISGHVIVPAGIPRSGAVLGAWVYQDLVFSRQTYSGIFSHERSHKVCARFRLTSSFLFR